jgi:hypothetical protein
MQGGCRVSGEIVAQRPCMNVSGSLPRRRILAMRFAFPIGFDPSGIGFGAASRFATGIGPEFIVPAMAGRQQGSRRGAAFP